MIREDRKTCIVGMSGGVDSAVTALLMKEMNYNVIGCTLKMQDTEKTQHNIDDVSKITDRLEIPFEVVDCIGDFKKYVIDYFAESYKDGRTPNPCVMCNSFVKFKYLNAFREKVGAVTMATGHYVQLRPDGLYQATDLTRDQSYFLYSIDPAILSCAVFPLGSYRKSEVREIAAKHKLHVSQKSDSQDICFISDSDYKSFLQSYSQIDFCKNPRGAIVDECGKILGEHGGLINYTVGQRKGLGLSGGPFFVRKIDVENNAIVVTNKDGLLEEKIYLKNVKFLNGAFSGECLVKIRSCGVKVRAKIAEEDRCWTATLLDPEYGAAFGQHCVFYDNDKVLGGGEIYDLTALC